MQVTVSLFFYVFNSFARHYRNLVLFTGHDGNNTPELCTSRTNAGGAPYFDQTHQDRQVFPKVAARGKMGHKRLISAYVI